MLGMSRKLRREGSEAKESFCPGRLLEGHTGFQPVDRGSSPLRDTVKPLISKITPFL